MPVPKAVLAGVAVAVVAGGGVAGVLLVADDDSKETAAATTTTSTETTTTTLPPETTTTTAATESPTTTAAARTTTTRVARSTTSTTAGPPTTVTATSCGTGKATVAFAAKDLRTDAQSSTFIPQAIVENQVSAPIEVEAVVIDVVYPDGLVRTVSFPTAGIVIAPGTSATFDGERLTTEKRYQAARITRFTYFTSGRPDACRVSAP